MKIYNAFGITPTNTYVSAGTDYYIPNIKTEKQKELAIEAFQKSYKVSKEDIDDMIKFIDRYINSNEDQINIIHLYLAYHNNILEEKKNESIIEGLKYFINNFLTYDGVNDLWGIQPTLNDTLFINSGIKVALDTVISDKFEDAGLSTLSAIRSLGIGVAGLYVNKSGMGNKGYDVRACLVDEDYSGYVHLSMAFTKDTENVNKNIYCGDKLTQMMLIPVFHTEYVEISEEEYNDIMSKSNRGDSAFGSSDIKH